MDLWIQTTRADLDALLPDVDLLILNDSEAREMTNGAAGLDQVRSAYELERGRTCSLGLILPLVFRTR